MLLFLQRSLWRASGQWRAHLPLVACVGCSWALVVVLLAGCSSGSVGSQATPPFANSGTPPTSSGGTPTLVKLTPITKPLAAPPQNCALKPPPQQMHLDHLGSNHDVQLEGGGTFWIYGFFYQSVVHMGQFGDNGGWPIQKIVVEVGPNYDQPVTLQLRNLETGALAWWTDAQTPPGAATQTLMLNPQTDNESVGTVPGEPDVPHGPPDRGWKEWGVFPLYYAAGCYRLEVSWAGGSWQSVYAVGI
jgi:hypothetical protein